MKIKHLIEKLTRNGPPTKEDSTLLEYLRTRDPEMYAWAPVFAILTDPDSFPSLTNELCELH